MEANHDDEVREIVIIDQLKKSVSYDSPEQDIINTNRNSDIMPQHRPSWARQCRNPCPATINSRQTPTRAPFTMFKETMRSVLQGQILQEPPLPTQDPLQAHTGMHILESTTVLLGQVVVVVQALRSKVPSSKTRESRRCKRMRGSKEWPGIRIKLCETRVTIAKITTTPTHTSTPWMDRRKSLSDLRHRYAVLAEDVTSQSGALPVPCASDMAQGSTEKALGSGVRRCAQLS